MSSLKVACESTGAGCAVTFADEELRGFPAFIASEIEEDKIADGFNISFEPVELLRLFTRYRSAEPSADGIDENEIGLV